MAAGCVITEECGLAVSADRMWKVACSVDNREALLKACAGFIEAVEVEGDSGPGSVTTLTLSPATAAKASACVIRTRLVARDGATLEAAGEGACVAKLRVEYKRLRGGALSPVDQAVLLTAGYLGLLKKIEAYLVANPAEYA
ncbi:hypothetical protein ACQ4PT_062087 [Festuca glaucescens]